MKASLMILSALALSVTALPTHLVERAPDVLLIGRTAKTSTKKTNTLSNVLTVAKIHQDVIKTGANVIIGLKTGQLLEQ
ncbi:hypothetical protein C8J56DRAFT_1060824 [Mycena floridula]|nr:hypothetical protein C8J56DRAFT_1060824 [Mycena floridula]